MRRLWLFIRPYVKGDLVMISHAVDTDGRVVPGTVKRVRRWFR